MRQSQKLVSDTELKEANEIVFDPYTEAWTAYWIKDDTIGCKNCEMRRALIRDQSKMLAAKDSLIAAMRINIKGKEQFISYLMDELRIFKEEKKHGGD